MTITISIGGYIIRMVEPNGYPALAWPLHPFEAFIASPDLPEDIHVDVSVVSPLPDFGSRRLRFNAGPGLWKSFDTDAGLMIESLHTLTLQPRVRAVVSDDYRTVRAWVLPEYLGGQVGWCPMYLFNPVVEVCLLTRLAREGGLLLHAAGLVSRRQGYVFTGPSGAGKSTLAQLFADRQAHVLSDERVILRRCREAVVVYGSPWVGSGHYAANSAADVTALYMIEHGEEGHRMTSRSPSRAVSQLLQQSFLPHWDSETMERTLDFLISVVTTIPCRHLAFLRQGDVVDFVHLTSSNVTTPA